MNVNSDKLIKNSFVVRTLQWKFERYGLFEAVFHDKKFVYLKACENGSIVNLWTYDITFLKAIHEAITDILMEIGDNNG